ncbi:hypothetical protein AYI68_g3473 [Smittium mucronatum]|uniref:Bromodomain associated domain-containing protein n=1 Tax=Smittium mucronatum TaxID=133383 RepID=A0A1R0GZW9_9FUNG|nr:hypothetical protein AYI68_g3473 [Smittium mucronatum]
MSLTDPVKKSANDTLSEPAPSLRSPWALEAMQAAVASVLIENTSFDTIQRQPLFTLAELSSRYLKQLCSSLKLSSEQNNRLLLAPADLFVLSDLNLVNFSSLQSWTKTILPTQSDPQKENLRIQLSHINPTALTSYSVFFPTDLPLFEDIDDSENSTEYSSDFFQEQCEGIEFLQSKNWWFNKLRKTIIKSDTSFNVPKLLEIELSSKTTTIQDLPNSIELKDDFNLEKDFNLMENAVLIQKDSLKDAVGYEVLMGQSEDFEITSKNSDLTTENSSAGTNLVEYFSKGDIKMDIESAENSESLSDKGDEVITLEDMMAHLGSPIETEYALTEKDSVVQIEENVKLSFEIQSFEHLSTSDASMNLIKSSEISSDTKLTESDYRINSSCTIEKKIHTIKTEAEELKNKDIYENTKNEAKENRDMHESIKNKVKENEDIQESIKNQAKENKDKLVEPAEDRDETQNFMHPTCSFEELGISLLDLQFDSYPKRVQNDNIPQQSIFEEHIQDRDEIFDRKRKSTDSSAEFVTSKPVSISHEKYSKQEVGQLLKELAIQLSRLDEAVEDRKEKSALGSELDDKILAQLVNVTLDDLPLPPSSLYVYNKTQSCNVVDKISEYWIEGTFNRSQYMSLLQSNDIPIEGTKESDSKNVETIIPLEELSHKLVRSPYAGGVRQDGVQMLYERICTSIESIIGASNNGSSSRAGSIAKTHSEITSLK